MGDPERELPDLHKVFDRMFSRQSPPSSEKQALFERSGGSKKSNVSPRRKINLASIAERFPAPWAARSQQVVGVDLGRSAIKLVCIENGQVTHSALQEIPQSLGDPEKKAFYRDRLQEFKRAGLLNGRLVMGVIEEKMAVESVMMPKMPDADLGKAVLWEAKERMAAEPPAHSIRHLVVEEALVDGQLQREVLIFAMPREEIAGSYGMIAGYGSRVAAAEPGILASAAALESAGLIQPGKFIGVLDIGFKHSTLALVIDGKIRFVRSFSVAGETLTQNIMHYCRISRDEAEAQKCLSGLSQIGVIEENPKEMALQVRHALSLSVEQLATELDHSLRYVTYYSLGRGKGGTMEKLYLAGGGALLKNLPGFLESRLDTRVELADPFRALPVSDAARAKLTAPETRARLTAALGLALRPMGAR